jgi:hypothetical protein
VEAERHSNDRICCVIAINTDHVKVLEPSAVRRRKNYPRDRDKDIISEDGWAAIGALEDPWKGTLMSALSQ